MAAGGSLEDDVETRSRAICTTWCRCLFPFFRITKRRPPGTGTSARLEALGKPAPFAAGQIAAIARTNGLALITVNVRDFARFKELRVADWSRSSGRE